MKRLGRFLVATGALALLASQLIVPAVATHVNEPTAPITGLHLRVLHYATGTEALCDWQVYPFIAARIQVRVNFDGKPSEHFHTKVAVVKLRGADPEARSWAGVIPMWQAGWAHQNVPPHGNTPPFAPFDGDGAWKVTDDETNTWFRDSSQKWTEADGEPGFYRVRATVTGEESGNTFTEECILEIRADAIG